MGDERRNEKFAIFISKQFPKAKKVLVVADGKGILARKLANKGLGVVVVENKPRFEGRIHPSISYKKGWFTRDTPIPSEVDIIVGMHPDEATAEIVLAAERNKKHWAIVPCCVKGIEANGISGYREWIAKLKKLCVYRCKEYMLGIQGKNLVLYRN